MVRPPGYHGIMHLIKNVVHHIKTKILIRVFASVAKIGTVHKLHQSTPDSIPVASNRRNILTKDMNENVIEWKKSNRGTHLAVIRIERS
jgi:hypothetical protein